ncbi:SRPBCC family protein [Kitasatospora sp. A2-31]|uniref:SRPBCC family protein n=1 Tax=Kitasatospora sp. A2-31 TaxID=2916414 RepID=UPI001EEA4D20|nr:SRPBCC family protein [Kitasatospora sp. A2-31]MCG6494377.1 SRPBCC family protein [Kitasatospora sp. A2-31]
MWKYEHSVETSAAPSAVWRIWADVATWPEWNTDIEKIELRGGFTDGGEITMVPRGQDPVELRLDEVTPGESFVDEAVFGPVRLRTVHQVLPVERGARITYRLEITGEGSDDAGPGIGPQITADWPETMAALARRAERY